MPAERLLADAPGIQRAAELVAAGQIVAFPTDTVYGIGCRWGDEHALERLFALKGRSRDRRVPVLVRSADDVPELRLRFDDRARRLAKSFWPGPLTIVMASADARRASVGVRAPDHPVALALLRLTGPMRVTSANVSGQPEALAAPEVHVALGKSELLRAVIDGGAAPGGRASTVLDLSVTPARIVRPGPISGKQIAGVIGRILDGD